MVQVAYTLQDTGRAELAAPLSLHLDSTAAHNGKECQDFLLMFLSLPSPVQDLVLKRCSIRNMILYAPPVLRTFVLRAHLLDGCRLNLCSTLKTPGAPPAIRSNARNGSAATPPPPPLLTAIAPLLHSLPSLSHLILAANALTPAAAPLLAKHLTSIPHLSHLDLSVNRLAHGVVELAPALSRLTALRLLDLGSNDLPATACCALAGSLRGHPSLRHLALGGNKLCPRSASALAELLHSLPHLQQLLLPRTPCPPGPQSAAFCGSFASATALGVLRLPQCSLDSASASALAAALPALRRLRVLDLALNTLSARSVAAIARGLRALPALLHLDLGWSNLGDPAACTSLAEALRAATFRTCLQSLLLSNGQLTSETAVGAGLFAAGLLGRPNGHRRDGGAIGGLVALTELNLSHNPLSCGGETLQALAATLAALRNLGSLAMDNCGIGDAFLRAFAAQALPVMPALETMTIAKNRFGATGAAAVRRARPRKLLYVHWDWVKPEYGSDTTATPPESEDEEPPRPPRISDV